MNGLDCPFKNKSGLKIHSISPGLANLPGDLLREEKEKKRDNMNQVTIKNKDFKTIIKRRRQKTIVVGIIAILFSLVSTLFFNAQIINPFLNEQQKNISDDFRSKLYQIAIAEGITEPVRKELRKLIDWPELLKTDQKIESVNSKIDKFMLFCCLFISFVTGIICLICIGYLKVNDIDTTFAEMGPMEQEQILGKIQQSLRKEIENNNSKSAR